MTQEFYGRDLAKYKLERAREELDTEVLLFENVHIGCPSIWQISLFFG